MSDDSGLNPWDLVDGEAMDPRLDALRDLGAGPETALAESGPNRSDLDALKDGAATMIQAGNRVAALALLWSAVAIDPTDRTAHRRLAATLARGGDVDGAADEYARYIEFMLPLGEVGRATMELSYGATMLGGHPALRDAAEKIVSAVRALVSNTNAAIAATTAAPSAPTVAESAPVVAPSDPVIEPTARAIAPSAPVVEPTAPAIAPSVSVIALTPVVAPAAVIAPAAVVAPASVIALMSVTPSTPVIAPAPVIARSAPTIATAPAVAASPAPAVATPRPTRGLVARLAQVPYRTPRLLPKVPFRFCIHQDGDRYWMQLEGGTSHLMPDAVRVVDRDENVVETRMCLPLEPGENGHARFLGDFAPSVAWVVVGIASDAVAAIDAGKASPYGLHAKVRDEWLATSLVDTGCRLGRTQAKSAVS